MTTKTEAAAISPILLLDGKLAADLMTPSVMSISITATLESAVFLLMDRRLSAVPVLDEHGKPVGVLSRTDIVAHDFKQYQYLHRSAETDGKDFPLNITETGSRNVSRDGPREEAFVEDVMTKVLYSVTPATPAKNVIDAMLALGVHRLFVTDDSGTLQGVISSTDILRRLREPMTVTFDQVELLATDRATCLEACNLSDGL